MGAQRRHRLAPIGMATVKTKIPRASEDVEKWEPPCAVGGNENGAAAGENSTAAPQKAKKENRHTIQQSTKKK